MTSLPWFALLVLLRGGWDHAIINNVRVAAWSSRYTAPNRHRKSILGLVAQHSSSWHKNVVDPKWRTTTSAAHAFIARTAITASTTVKMNSAAAAAGAASASAMVMNGTAAIAAESQALPQPQHPSPEPPQQQQQQQSWQSSISSLWKLRNTFDSDELQLAQELCVRPVGMAPKWMWKWAWRIHGFLLRHVLHTVDSARPHDSYQSLKVLWCKALAALDPQSAVYEEPPSWTCDCLPGSSRCLLRIIPLSFFPRWHHANIEIRTAYLQRTLQRIMQDIIFSNDLRNDAADAFVGIRLIILGAGYDVRSVAFLNPSTQQHPTLNNINNRAVPRIYREAYELDLPDVIQSKCIMLDRLVQRRQQQQQQQPLLLLPHLIQVDLNDVSPGGAVECTLQRILQVNATTTITNTTTTVPTIQWHNIFVTEGLLIYLQPGIPTRLLQLCHQQAAAVSSSSSSSSSSITTSYLCWADSMRDVLNFANTINNNTSKDKSNPAQSVAAVSTSAGKMMMMMTGWHVQEWYTKPGLARHMGWAKSGSEERKKDQIKSAVAVTK